MERNNELIRKYKLEETVRRLQQINEYTFYGSEMVEDDQPQNQGQMPHMNNVPADGGISQGNDMGGQMPTMDNAPAAGEMPQGNDMGGQMPPMNNAPADGGMPQGNDMGGQMPPMDNAPADGDMAGEANGSDFDDMEDIEMDTEQHGDEVINVDDLTQSQETTEFKVDNVDDKLNKVLSIISKFNDAIEANDKKIEDLKQEFEKRNPTAEETLNLRSMASYPFSERPDEYWKKQQSEHPNYNVVSNNDVPTAKEQEVFEIKDSDINNFNERDIMNSLGEGKIKLCDFIDF